MTEQPPIGLAQWRALTAEIAQKYGLDFNTILAQIWTESEGNATAYRYEKGYIYFYLVDVGPLYDRHLTVEQNRQKALVALGQEEFDFQSASHGLLQPLGAVAREFGLRGDWRQIYQPEVNLALGCAYLKWCLKRTDGNYKQALVKYNGSGRYSDLVLRRKVILESQSL